MSYTPLLMLRTRGMNGPFFANHCRISGLSKSSGSYFGKGGAGNDPNLIDDPTFDSPDNDDPWITTGWTIANGAATCGGAAGATLIQFPA